jgi:hypothetical protein
MRAVAALLVGLAAHVELAPCRTPPRLSAFVQPGWTTPGPRPAAGLVLCARAAQTGVAAGLAWPGGRPARGAACAEGRWQVGRLPFGPGRAFVSSPMGMAGAAGGAEGGGSKKKKAKKRRVDELLVEQGLADDAKVLHARPWQRPALIIFVAAARC